MIWKSKKAGQPCPGCGVGLIDEPWKTEAEIKKTNPLMRWLLHEDTMLTICTTKE